MKGWQESLSHVMENKSVQLRLYSVYLLLSECHEWSAAIISTFVVVHAAGFVMNAALVASQ